MQFFVIDSFNDAGGTPANRHTPELGSTLALWTPEGDSPGVIITPGRWGMNTGTVAAATYASAPPYPDCYIDWQIETNADAHPGYAGVMGRAQNASITRVLARLSGPSNLWEIYVQVAGTIEDYQSTPATIAPNTVYNCRLALVGNTATLFVNGAQILAADASTVAGTGRPGLHAYTAAGAPSDWTIRNFRCSTFPTTPIRALYEPNLTFADYTPPTSLERSSLTLWLNPRNIVLKDIAADAAWAAIQALTNPDFQF